LALIADNRVAEMQRTLGSTGFDMSHLCNNGKCFNPVHLVAESKSQNMKRRTCVGHKVILYGDFEYHPCQHGEIEEMRKCILSVLRL
ncbi:zinc-binding loop region of homing endonuclease, partial [Lipomyces starkeyi]